MRISQALYAFVAVGAVLLVPTDSYAHRIYMSLTGPPSDLTGDGITEQPALAVPGARNGQPMITLDVGQSMTLYQWLNPDNGGIREVAGGPILPMRNFNSVAYDIVASDPGVARMTGFEFSNPTNEASGGATPNRWDGTSVQAIATDAASTQWVTNAAGASVLNPGISNNMSNSAANVSNRLDQGRDDVVVTGGAGTTPHVIVSGTGDYYLGSMTVEGVQAGLIGVYFRVGLEKIVVRNQTTHPVQFGHNNDTYQGNVTGAGDIITEDLANADLIIRVNGPVISRLNILSQINDPETTPDRTVPGPNGKQQVNVPFGTSEGTLIAEDWTESPQFDVWLDIRGGAPEVAQALALLQAQSNDGIEADYMVELSPGQEFEDDWPVDYDIHVRMALRPAAPGDLNGPDQVFDFDFGTTGIIVDNVAIPEPSSVALSAMALIGMAFYGWRRRRSA